MNGFTGASALNNSESLLVLVQRVKHTRCSTATVKKGEDLLRSTNITEDKRKVYSTVLEKLNGFFHVRKNIIFERAKFNRRCQLVGETADQFIMSLYNLADNCNYGNLKDEMIRDRLVVGIRDVALFEKLQIDTDLMLEKAKKSIRQ